MSSRIQSRPTGSGSKIGGAKTTPPGKATKAGSKPPSGSGAAKSTANAANAAELKALQEQVAQLQDQVSPYFFFSLSCLYSLFNYTNNSIILKCACVHCSALNIKTVDMATNSVQSCLYTLYLYFMLGEGLYLMYSLLWQEDPETSSH